MKGSFEKIFHIAVLAMLVREPISLPVVEVISVTQDTVEEGGCETCYSEYDVIYVAYVDTAEETQTYTWIGNMAEFIRELDRE